MEAFEYFNPVRVLYGDGTADRIGEVTAAIGRVAMIVTYRDAEYMTPLLERVTARLTEAGVEAILYRGASANPTLGQAREGVALCRERRAEVLIGIGGGSAMDLTKVIAAGALYPRDVRDMIMFSHSEVTAIPPVEALPTVMMPTLPATGSEMNPTAVVTDESTREKSYVYAPQCLYPRVSLIDPTLTVTLPPYQTACGAIDIAAHVMESYVNGDGADEGLALLDGMQEGVMRAVLDALPDMMARPRDTALRGMAQWASAIALNGWLTSGTYGFTPMHQMGHALSARYAATHGATLCVMMIAWLRYFDRRSDNARYVKLAKNVFRRDTPAEAADALASLAERFGVQTTLRGFGADESDLAPLAAQVRKISFSPDNKLQSNPRLSERDILDIFRIAF